jgi:hypothetical protein
MTGKTFLFQRPKGGNKPSTIGVERLWRPVLLLTYLMATVQVASCYFTLVRPYINTSLYESGRERLPFQTRILMMPLMRWAHHSAWAAGTASVLKQSRFWYLRPAEPEAIVQLLVNIASLLIAGWVAQSIYRAASATNRGPSGLLAPFVYPLFLLLCTVQYILHTIQNFRFIYDLPGMAFFAVGLYLIYFRKHPAFFAALFVVATVNRETALLLLPFYMLSAAVGGGTYHQPKAQFNWRRAFAPAVLAVVVPLCCLWLGWHFYIFPSRLAQFVYPDSPSLLAADFECWGLHLAVSGNVSAPHGRFSIARMAVGVAHMVRVHVLLGDSGRDAGLRRVDSLSDLHGRPRG